MARSLPASTRDKTRHTLYVTLTLGRHWFSCLSVSSSSCFIACAIQYNHHACVTHNVRTRHRTRHRTRPRINLRARLDVDACDAGAEGGIHGHVITAAHVM